MNDAEQCLECRRRAWCFDCGCCETHCECPSDFDDDYAERREINAREVARSRGTFDADELGLDPEDDCG